MGIHCTEKNLLTLCLLVALAAIILPVGAVNGTISIIHRGYGSYYIGDTIIFDGYNSFSDVTYIRINGPGLPAEGVPIYDLNGVAGSGSPIPGVTQGSWKFAWYMSTIKGIEKLKSAKYYFTVFDSTYPEKTATTSVLLKKPDFYFTITPESVMAGNYIQLTGIAEKGIDSVRFDMANSRGEIVYRSDSTVSSTGDFNKGFHVDLPPGTYTVTMSSPNVKTTYRSYLTVQPVNSSGQNPAATGTIPSDAIPTIPASPGFTLQPSDGTGTLLVISDPIGATAFLDSIMQDSTPIEIYPVTSGTHLVEIKAPGYQTYSEQVMVKPGETTTVSTVLSRKTSATPLSLITVICGILISFVLVLVPAQRRKN
jgi:hypothetical protein